MKEEKREFCSSGGQEGSASGQAVWMGQSQWYEVEQREVLGPALGPQQAHAALLA